jgi:heme-degrading monooxygenase HmoA
MHATVLHVTINDADAATSALREQIVPQVSSAPGFVGGYWVRLSENKGISVVAWESEEAANRANEQIQPPGDFVSFDSREVGEVVANA